jgi:hemoglobin-like flavoprotein
MDQHETSTPVPDHVLLAESLGLIAPVADQVIESFYDQLFAENPDVRPMFPTEMSGQRDKLLKAIIAVVTHYEQPADLLPALTAMGRRHGTYGIRIDHYSTVGLTLLATLRRFAGQAWTPAYEGAWLRAYTYAAGVMMQAGAVVEPRRAATAVA